MGRFLESEEQAYLNFCATEGISSTSVLVSLWSLLFCSVEICAGGFLPKRARKT
jgi:hypothetical protein